jgi:hypothetical protein
MLARGFFEFLDSFVFSWHAISSTSASCFSKRRSVTKAKLSRGSVAKPKDLFLLREVAGPPTEWEGARKRPSRVRRKSALRYYRYSEGSEL